MGVQQGAKAGKVVGAVDIANQDQLQKVSQETGQLAAAQHAGLIHTSTIAS